MDALINEFSEPTSNAMPSYSAENTADLLACLRRIQPTAYLCTDLVVGWKFRTERTVICDNNLLLGVRHFYMKECQNPRYAENVTFE